MMSPPRQRKSAGSAASRRSGSRRSRVASADLALQPGERRAQAVVDAVPVSEVLIVTAGEVQGVRHVEPLRVPVGGGQHHEDGSPAAMSCPPSVSGLGGVPPGRQLHRAVVAQQFLDARGEQRPSPRLPASVLEALALPAGCAAARSVPLPMRLTVVSKPAKSRMNAIAAASFSREVLAVVARPDQPGDQVVARDSRRLRWMSSAR